MEVSIGGIRLWMREVNYCYFVKNPIYFHKATMYKTINLWL